jgi:hypothetical protein
VRVLKLVMSRTTVGAHIHKGGVDGQGGAVCKDTVP